jgi:hypothetical protein
LAVTTDSFGLQTLRQAKAMLTNKLTQLASSSGQ